jgi:hypothetical protein
MAKKKVIKCGVKREKGFMYYINSDGDVWKFPRGGGRKSKVCDAGLKREKGMLYFIDKDGDISSAPAKRK